MSYPSRYAAKKHAKHVLRTVLFHDANAVSYEPVQISPTQYELHFTCDFPVDTETLRALGHDARTRGA